MSAVSRENTPENNGADLTVEDGDHDESKWQLMNHVTCSNLTVIDIISGVDIIFFRQRKRSFCCQ